VARLLVVTHAYAPLVSPRAFRWTALCEEFARQGHRVNVVAGPAPGAPAYEVRNGVVLHRVAERGLGALRARASAAHAAAAPVGASSFKQRALGFLKAVYHHTWRRLYWPDYAALWVTPATRVAENLLRHDGFDALITVSLPFSGHVVGLNLKKRHPTLPWMADIGDPFSFMDSTPVNNVALWGGRNHKADAAVCAAATVLSVTTEGTREEYARRFPRGDDKLRVLPPLLSLPEGPAASPYPAGRHLVYMGTLYRHLRSPEPLLDLIKGLDTSAGPLAWHFVGSENDAAPCFAPYADLQGTLFHRHGLQPRAAAAAYLAHADVLVNIGNDTTYQLPSKVVEYLAMGKPIVNLVRDSSDSSARFFAPYDHVLTLADTLPLPEKVARLRHFLTHLPPPPTADELARRRAPFTPATLAHGYLAALGLENAPRRD
jgi:hypothetical protein